jgi:predicted Zn finger-like uncharacterized protein
MQVECPHCGTRYRVPDASAGQRARCKRCGRPFALGTPPPELDDELRLTDIESLGRGQAVAAPPSPAPSAAPVRPAEAAAVSLGYAKGTAVGEGGAVGGAPMLSSFAAYPRDVAGTLRLLVTPGGLVTFVFVWMIVSVRLLSGFALCLALPMILITTGWYLAYLLSVVESGAAGEDELPGLTLTEGFVDGIFMPLLKFLAVSVVATLPLDIALTWSVGTGRMALEDAFAVLLSSLATDYGPLLSLSGEELLILGPSLLMAILLQPILLLVVAIGGIRSLIRFDLIFGTIARTLPVYLAVLLLVCVCLWVPDLLVAPVVKAAGPDPATIMGGAGGAERAVGAAGDRRHASHRAVLPPLQGALRVVVGVANGESRIANSEWRIEKTIGVRSTPSLALGVRM